MPASTEVQKCQYEDCGKSLKTHPRCGGENKVGCQILLHPQGKEVPATKEREAYVQFLCRCQKQHSLKGENGMCENCSKK